MRWRYALELFEFPNPVQCLPVMYVCMYVGLVFISPLCVQVYVAGVSTELACKCG